MNTRLVWLLCMIFSTCNYRKLTVKASPEPITRKEGVYYFVKIGMSPPLCFAKEEVSTAAFCGFLNDVGYSLPAVRVEGIEISGADQARLQIGGYEHHTQSRVFLVEHPASNVVRRNGHFEPESESDADRPANSVTFFGAQAYCEWLARRTGENVRLPTELEWHACASSLAGEGAPLIGCPGDVWEWCQDWFIPGRSFRLCESYTPPEAGEQPYPKHVIRGGKYMNRGLATINDRAGSLLLGGGLGEQPIGFRVVIAGK